MTTALTITRGDDEVIAVTVLQPNSTTLPMDITGYVSLRFTAKRKITDLDVDAVIFLVTGDGIEVTDEETGAVTVTIDHSLTDDLTKETNLYWDLQLVDAAGRIQTLKQGTLKIVTDVTRTAP